MGVIGGSTANPIESIVKIQSIPGRWPIRPLPLTQCGFTIVELMVVLAIGVVAFSTIMPNFSAGTSSARFKSAARDIASALRHVRGRAVSTLKQAEFFIDVEKNIYRVSGKDKEYRVPEKIQLGLFTAESELTGDQQGIIRFFPDGSSTGGRVTLEEGNRKRLVDVNWLTGLITIRSDEEE